MITIRKYSRDVDELRMDAQDMLAEMQNEDEEVIDIDFRQYEMIENCIHGVSRLYLCPYCETVWEEELQSEEDIYEQFCKGHEPNESSQAESSC